MKTVKQLLLSSNWIKELATRLQVRRASNSSFTHSAKSSFSQAGEDILISLALERIGVKTPTYLDIGAFHPTSQSNTYYFYQQGACGVCVEPNPTRVGDFVKARPRDICVNAGVGIRNETEADFYVLTSAVLCTFSKQEALRLTNFGQKIESVEKIRLLPIEHIICEYCKSTPNIVSIDVEGLDLEIISSFNFAKRRPDVFCVETLSAETQYTKNSKIIQAMEDNEYSVFADTFINTIFVRKEAIR